MELTRLIEGLSRPEAYPHPVDGVEVRQTHISVVFLAGAWAYKIKKAVDLGFLDFTTLEERLHFCNEEVRLNRRLAPDVYLGVVPVVEGGGQPRVGGGGAPLEYAVKMERLPDGATMLERLRRGELDEPTVQKVGRRIAAFHAEAASPPEADRYGSFPIVAANARENLDQSRGHVGTCLSAPVFARLEERLEERLKVLRPLIDARARAHVPRDTHGDLHLDHIYFFPDRPPPRDLVIIDCIEFNERFRYADPVADLAFLVMDLVFRGRRDLAMSLTDTYFRTADDREGRELLSFYVAYRAAVRGKVEGMAAEEIEVPQRDREEAVRLARGHWLLALSELEAPELRPCLVLVGGLPGTGKTTLVEGLASRAGFQVVSTDRIRKELAGLPPDAPARAAFGEGIYTPEWDDRTYAACLQRAGDLVFEGGRVIVDASFREAHRRETFHDAALSWGVRSTFLLCTAPRETVELRMSERTGGPSDADWSVYRAMEDLWESGGMPGPGREPREVPTEGTREEALAGAVDHLRECGLAR